MKTTLDLPDDLLVAARQAAARRRTTLKEMVTRSLRREIGLDSPPIPKSAPYEIGEHGYLQLKKRSHVVTTEVIDKIREDEGI